MKIELSKPVIGTITCIGQIYKQIIPKSVNVLKLYDYLPIGKDFTYMCFYGDDNGTVIRKFKGNKKRKRKNTKKSSKRKKKFDEFLNALAIEVRINDFIISGKISTNGMLQFVGSKSRETVDKFIRILNDHLSRVREIRPDIVTQDIDVSVKTMPMIIYFTRIITPGIYIDNEALYYYVINKPEFEVEYSRIKSQSLSLEHNGILFLIFQTGRINVTKITLDQVDSSFEYITQFLNDNINKFIMTDKVLKVLEELHRGSAKQKSSEWFRQRGSTISASEVAAVMGMDYGYRGLHSFITSKVKSMKGIPRYVNANCVNHGNCFEPIAQQLYVHIINNKIGRPHKIAHLEAYFKTHPDYERIGATPDGYIPVLPEDIQNPEKLSIPELISLAKEGKIADIYLLEIKCPKNYKKYIAETMPGMINKCVKVHGGYVPEYYWCQIQQQLAVTGLKYCAFMNNNFIRYNSLDEFRKQPTGKYYGMILMYLAGEEKFIYPDYEFLLGINAATRDHLIEKMKKMIKDENLSRNDISQYSFIYWNCYDVDICEVNYDQIWYEKQIPNILNVYKQILNEYEIQKDIDFCDEYDML